MPVQMFSLYASHLQGPKAEAKQIPGEQYACPNVFTVRFLQAASHAKKRQPEVPIFACAKEVICTSGEPLP